MLDEPKLDLSEVIASPYEKNGKTYIQVKQMTVKVESVKNLHLKLENLFNGNKQLGKFLW